MFRILLLRLARGSCCCICKSTWLNLKTNQEYYWFWHGASVLVSFQPPKCNFSVPFLEKKTFMVIIRKKTSLCYVHFMNLNALLHWLQALINPQWNWLDITMRSILRDSFLALVDLSSGSVIFQRTYFRTFKCNVNVFLITLLLFALLNNVFWFIHTQCLSGVNALAEVIWLKKNKQMLLQSWQYSF